MAAILCLADRRCSRILNAVKRAGHDVYAANTADLAVCLCVQHSIDIAILGQDLFVETDGWSVAQSIKGVRPTVRTLLLTNSNMISKARPKGVDSVLPIADIPALLRVVNEVTETKPH